MGQWQVLPELTAEEYAALKADIAERGVQVPVEYDEQGAILDGHHRVRACQELGVSDWPRVVRKGLTEEEKRQHVIALNLARRHLNESQRAMIAARLVNTPAHRPEREPIGSLMPKDEAAQLLNVSPRAVQRARMVLEAASPETIAKVERGELAVSRAAKEVRERERREEWAAQAEAVKAEEERWWVHVADMRTWQTDWLFDFIITDPPYAREYLPLYGDLGRRAAEWLKPGGSCLVMCGQSYLPEIMALMTPHLTYHWTIAYLTPGGQAAQLWQRKVNTFWKPVLWFTKGDYQGRWLGDVARSETNGNDKRHHAWGQSESGMADLLGRITEPGDLILDPFMGAGTTGVVAVSLARLFVGLDTDEAAVTRARERLQCVR